MNQSRQADAAAEHPTVSVICHTFNHEPYLAQALNGILSQQADFPFELIVHDDASTDGTSAILRDYAERHPGIIVPIVQSENQYSRQRRPIQFSFPRARGEFVALCEGDDYWIDPHKLNRQVAALRRYPGVNLCIHAALRLSMASGKTKKAFAYGRRERVLGGERAIARRSQFSPTASIMFRREAARAMPAWWLNGPPAPPIGDWFIEAVLGRNGVLYLPEVMSVYRRGVPGSYTQRFRNASGSNLEATLDRLVYFTEDLRGMEGIPDRALDRRLSLVHLDFALQFLAAADRQRFARASLMLRLRDSWVAIPLAAMRHSTTLFAAGRKGLTSLRWIQDRF